MINKILTNRNLDFPYITYTLALCCLITSLTIFFFPEFNQLLNADNNITFAWQRFTATFAHGAGGNKQFLIIHLLGNLLGLISFGILIEKILGTTKYFILVITTLIINVGLFYINHGFGNGVSGIVYANIPLGSTVLYKYVDTYKKNVFKYPGFLFYSFLTLWAAFILPAIFPLFKINAIMSHDIAFFIGGLFLFIWVKKCTGTIDEVVNSQYITKSNKINKRILRVIITGIPVFITALIFLTHVNIIQLSKVNSILPKSGSSLQEINANNNQIIMTFNYDIHYFKRRNLYVNSHDNDSTFGVDFAWVNKKKLIIQFKRALKLQEYVEATFEFIDSERETIVVNLEYGK
ncbi:MAG: rhomboid family intramembrane serine protease [Chitinispirillia bacterium]|jgi:membrane associated rhomboid family serine protease